MAAELSSATDCSDWRVRLERGEILHLPQSPFAFPSDEDCDFLYQCRLNRLHKNISFDPAAKRLTSLRRPTGPVSERLAQILDQFGQQASAWLASCLPEYARCWTRDRVSYRPEE